MEQMPKSITVDVHLEDGQFWAQVREYPGCFAAGFTPKELEASLSEGLSLYLSEPGRPVRVKLSFEREDEPTEFVSTQKVAVCA